MNVSVILLVPDPISSSCSKHSSTECENENAPDDAKESKVACHVEQNSHKLHQDQDQLQGMEYQLRYLTKLCQSVGILEMTLK